MNSNIADYGRFLDHPLWIGLETLQSGEASSFLSIVFSHRRDMSRSYYSRYACCVLFEYADNLYVLYVDSGVCVCVFRYSFATFIVIITSTERLCDR